MSAQFLINEQGDTIGIDHITRIDVSGNNLQIFLDDGTTITYNYGSSAVANATKDAYNAILSRLSNDRSGYVLDAGVPPAALTLVSVNPVSGSVGDGAVLTGTGFLAQPILYLMMNDGAGHTPSIDSFAVSDDMTLSFIVPTTPAGLYDIVISYFPDFSSPQTLAAAYTVV
jgi:hypothetical protein